MGISFIREYDEKDCNNSDYTWDWGFGISALATTAGLDSFCIGFIEALFEIWAVDTGAVFSDVFLKTNLRDIFFYFYIILHY